MTALNTKVNGNDTWLRTNGGLVHSRWVFWPWGKDPSICFWEGEFFHMSAEGGGTQGEAPDLYIRPGHTSLIAEYQGERGEVWPC